METTKYFMVSPSKKMRECFDTVLEVGVSQENKKQRRLEEQRVAGREVEWNGRPAEPVAQQSFTTPLLRPRPRTKT